ELLQLPYVGCGVLGSAVGMDKEIMKRLLAQAQIPNSPYLVLKRNKPHSFLQISETLGLPFFIKPARTGSSVGVHKIRNAEDFAQGLEDAFKYDDKILAEKFIKGREIECSVLGSNDHPKASLPGEIVPQHEFYSYDAKYLDANGALLVIPAELSKSVTLEVQEMAKKTYSTLECEGLSRVDFFLTEKNELFVNEINTLPGFTKISMYPKMWEASGLNYKNLITDLIHLAFTSAERKARLITSL
ncbi:MAG TPA: D-alanine--D-alanine ligase family protein, partial [Pseudobdellovibrionaceae bacterium]|nr:D-alanine--D-alanine ligase family protein [Pseudobdellovibrionaceae bacterium]